MLEISKYVHGMFYVMSDSDNVLEKNTASGKKRKNLERPLESSNSIIAET